MTPIGPAWTVASGTIVIHGGEGRAVICRRDPDPCGLRDTFGGLEAVHPIVARLQRDFGGLRIGSSGDVYKAALTATLGQRITAAEAVNQWARLCRALPTFVETPVGSLLAPPDPARLAVMAPYQLHTLGIEEARARALIAVARVFRRPGHHHVDPSAALRRLVVDVPRFGPWTQALVTAEALGDPDAVAVGDFHLKNVVAHALTGRPRGSDDEMLATLSPYAGNRGRVLTWLALGGISAPKFGPRRRNIDFRRF
jgi:3-methyladenine DNA glycosylase/8-oxoguanine DNA glycosylase